jgi:hypothetical protein
MAGLPWIRVYSELPDDERSLLLARKLRKHGAYLHMLALRLWMAKKAPDGIVGGLAAGELVEEAAAWDGEPGVFLQAAVAVGFLVETSEPRKGYADVSWREEQAAHVAKLERDRERAARRRESSGPSHGRADAVEATTERRSGDRPATVRGTSPTSRHDVHATVATTSMRPSPDGRATESRDLRVESRDLREEKDLPPIPPVQEGDQRPLLAVVPTPKPAPEELQAIWNRVAVPKGLGRWEAMSPARRTAARLALEACPALAQWEAWLVAELQNPFNLGQNDGRWRADVDWFLRVKTRDKVRDFDPARAPPRPRGAQIGHYGEPGKGDEITDEDINGPAGAP